MSGSRSGSTTERIVGRLFWFLVMPLVMVAIAIGFVVSACWLGAVTGWEFAEEALDYVGD